MKLNKKNSKDEIELSCSRKFKTLTHKTKKKARVSYVCYIAIVINHK